MVSSDKELISKVRSDLGFNNIHQMSNNEMESILEETKSTLRRELIRHIEVSDNFDFYSYNCRTAILLNHFRLQMKMLSEDYPENGKTPTSIQRIRRTDFEDNQMNYWKNQLIKNILEICE